MRRLVATELNVRAQLLPPHAVRQGRDPDRAAGVVPHGRGDGQVLIEGERPVGVACRQYVVDPVAAGHLRILPAVPESHNALPVRVTGIEVNDVADGLVVFVAATEQVHYLNSAASIVYELCDGTRSVSAITDEANALLPSESWALSVGTCLEDLIAKGLIQWS